MAERLAIDGGRPVRTKLLPYGRQSIEAEDIAAVVDVLQSAWLTTGPQVEAFEHAFSEVTGAPHAVAVTSGTAALHAAMFAAGVGPGDEVVVPAMTFAASANAVVYQGGTPVFADVDPETLLVNPTDVARHVTNRTKVIVAVDYAGQPCAYDALRHLTETHGMLLIADACHSLGGAYAGRPVGTLADMSAFSFHPVKHITTGEGGMIATANPELARKLRLFRNHGITTDHRQREAQGSWFYEMVELGYNYRLTDIGCALGASQLRRLGEWVDRRRAIARRYDEAFADVPGVRPLRTALGAAHAYHLYVVRFDPSVFSVDRAAIFAALRAEGIGVNVHYIPVHLHPFYRARFGTGPGLCPSAEQVYSEIVSLPMFPRMTDADIVDVIDAVRKVAGAYDR